MSLNTSSSSSMEQQLQKFMIQQFQPSGVSFREGGHENISEQLAPYFMPISGGIGATPVVASSDETNIFKPIAYVASVKDNIIPVTIKHENKPQTLYEKERGNGNKPLDQYWAFWAAYIATNGMEAYENISEKERFRFRLEQKAKASEWMVEDFKRTKTIMAPHWYRLTNRDMEDMATSLMTNADESKEGLDCMVMMWNYYVYGVGGVGGGHEDGLGSCKSESELYWVHPAKKVFYKLSMTKMDTIENETATESDPVAGPVWGVFVKEKTGNGGKTRNFSYELRKLSCSERDEMEKNRIGLSHVDKPLMAVSKYTLKELVDMGDIFGVQPPPMKSSGELDMDTLVSEAEINLGVVRKKPLNKKDLEENSKESKKSLERWKKGDWYENLEIYLSEIF